MDMTFIIIIRTARSRLSIIEISPVHLSYHIRTLFASLMPFLPHDLVILGQVVPVPLCRHSCR